MITALNNIFHLDIKMLKEMRSLVKEYMKSLKKLRFKQKLIIIGD
jgi:hypothetical protein